MGYALPIDEINPLQSAAIATRSTTTVSLELERQRLNSRYLELALAQELQSTLSIDTIIQRFSTLIAPHIDHSGIQLTTTESKVVTLEGERSRHQEAVELILEGESFGTVTLMKRQPIHHSAAIYFRYLARYLVYPIKNALLIHSLQLQTVTDPLTGAFNRTALNHDLHQEVERAERYQAPVTVVMLDIDHFKRINDRYGHSAGDQVIATIAGAIREQIRNVDSLYRYGGEEFTLLLRDTPERQGAIKVAAILERLRRLSWKEIDPDLVVTMSAGVAEWQPHEEGHSLIERADQLLYRAKEQGRDRVVSACKSEER